VLKLDDVHVHYGRVHVLRGISLEVPDGAVVALLGANGAGKTTTLKTISGILKPTRGSIHFDGDDLSRLDAADISCCSTSRASGSPRSSSSTSSR
jgi:branched-chain amino acid transport system ATP-binding protein